MENDNNGPETLKFSSELPSSDSERVPKSEKNAYVYRWTYDEQSLFDRRKMRKRKKGGAFFYALIMLLVFLLAFGALFAVLWLNGGFQSEPLVPKNDNAQSPAGISSEIVDHVNHATVLISTGAYSGSGFLINSDGYIVTNRHVIENGDDISVELYDGTTKKATVIASCRWDDVAVLKIEDGKYPTVSMGDSNKAIVGEPVFAFGNPGGSLCSWSVSHGIISAVNRKMDGESEYYITESFYLQTDAPLNHGNSGGPLCNNRGEVIGIISSKIDDSSVPQSEGLGLAIPISGVIDQINAIISKGTAEGVASKVTRTHPRIGVTGATIEKGDKFTILGTDYYAGHSGVLVVSVDQSGFSYGKLEVGDVIYEMDGVSVDNMPDFVEMLFGHVLGDTLNMKVDRLGTLVDVSVDTNIILEK